MSRIDDRVLCRTPTPGKQGTRIPRTRFDLVRRAILKATPLRGDGIAFRDLPAEVARRLTAAERKSIGSIAWHTTTVKLELEVRGEIVRVPGSRPQRIRRAG